MKQASKALIQFWIDQVVAYARKEGLKIDPLPNLQLVDGSRQQNNADELLISTGGYIPALKQIVLYIDNRHLKDIVRSYCHELIHHAQNLDNSDFMRRVFAGPDGLEGNPMLEELEGDAYLRGNLLFRKFTEWFKDKKKASAK